MSQNQQRAPPPRSPGGGGSVRRARERMEAGLPPQMPPTPQMPPPPRRPYDPSRDGPRDGAGSPPNRPRPQMPQALAGSLAGQGPIGVAISRPTQVPQWPLAGTIETGSDNGKPRYQPPAGRGPAPQRPPRPSRVPSILDASRLQEHTPTFQYKAPQSRYEEDEDPTSPSMRSPMTASSMSRPSTISSVGSIPDFPLPNIPPPPPPNPPRRSANLGPPPSSRRGASSYYSQISYVSPIPEEHTPTRSHTSYASSAAIPSSWGSDSNYDEGDDDLDMESPTRDMRDDIIEEGRESRESNNDDNDERGLVRKASIGKRVQPSMITTSSGEKIPPMLRPGPNVKQGSKLERMGILPSGSQNPVATAAAGDAAARVGQGVQSVAARTGAERPETQWPIPGGIDSPLAGGTEYLDTLPSSDETVPTLATAMTTDLREPAPTYNPDDTKAKEMLAAYNGASSLQPGGVSPIRTPSPGFSRLSAIRRPPRLNIDAVRDAEARGSLTSLPDLIRRATRLAAMMERGKRPASRFDLNDFPFSGDEKQRDRDTQDFSSNNEKHRSGLSGMLAAFPPPGVATPVQERSPRPISPWPSPSYQDSQGALNESNGPKNKKRKCCGLPCWGFLLVLIIIFLIIAAAIVVPLELLVFNKDRSANQTTASTSETLSACQTLLKCENGGTNIVSSGVCSCLCVNGFTGTTCTVASAPGCATTSINSTDTTGSYTNVTLGDAISRLIDDAQTNFSIPLFTSIIVARFNTANLSCSSENALVTFDGLDTRMGQATDVVVPTATGAARKRDEDSTHNDLETLTLFPTTSVVTSFIGSQTSSPSSTTISTQDPSTTLATAGTSTKTSTSKTTTSAATASTSSSATTFSITEQVLDFSRVAVLFVLQQENVNSAITAQSALQKFFSSDNPTTSAAGNLSIGSSNTINLVNLSVDLGNGTVGQNNVVSSRRRRGVFGRKAIVESYPS